MQATAHSRPITRLARWVLLWFALALGAAIASPVIKPQSIELLCSASGMTQVLVKNDQGDVVTSRHTLDCALCLSVSAPPPQAASFVAPCIPLDYALQPVERARLAALTAPPLPARGPPSV